MMRKSCGSSRRSSSAGIGPPWPPLRDLGLAFKPNTDDVREAPSLEIIAGLTVRGADVVAYDPVAMPAARRMLGSSSQLEFAATPMDAVAGADALIVVTEWKEFRSPDFAANRGEAQAAAAVRRPQPVRPHPRARRGARVLFHRPPLDDAARCGVPAASSIALLHSAE
jgi:hypothetical protein